jgi:hypothetical protein
MKRILILSLLCLIVTACSTVLEGPLQEVRVETPGVEGATCFLLRPGLSKRVFPPQTVKITRTNDDLTVRCTAMGNRERSILIENRLSDSAMLNVYNGLLPGILYDYDTGALFKFPDIIRVSFADVLVKPMPLPDYQKFLMENPMIADMEEFRPGQPALQRDRYEEVPTLQPRVPQVFDDASGTSDNAAGEEGSAATTSENKNAPTSLSPAENLTRQMNPGVFDGGSGGISRPAPPVQYQGGGAIPVPIYPSTY